MIEDEMSLDEKTPAEKESDLEERARSFDLEAWLNGLSRLRRAVTLYSDLGANAELDVLRTRETELRESGASRDEIEEVAARRRQVAKRITDSAVDVVLEGRSAEWLNEMRRKVTAEGKEPTAGLLEIIAAQIVQPEGITADVLAVINEKSPGQMANLMNQWKQLQTESGVELPL